MAETSGFFDAVYDESSESYDLEYFSSQFAAYFALFIGNGVFGSPTNQLKVSSGDGLSVKVSAGWAFINGYWYYNDEDLVLSIPSNLSSTARSDSVVCRWDAGSRKICTLLQVGSTGITRNDSIHDLKLADIVVPASATTIPESNITDTRIDEEVCGLVTQLLNVQTTADLFAQYEAIFNVWFDGIKEQVTGDLAIRLQQEFDELNQTVEEYQANVNASVEEIHKTADDAYSIMKQFTDNDFTLELQTLTFINSQCVIADKRVTEDSLVDVYFTSDTMDAAEAAMVYVDSAEGRIILTAANQPTTSLKARIRVRVM